MALVFDAIDQNNINAAIAAGGDVWYNDALTEVRKKIRLSFMSDDLAQCCYCARSFKGEFKMVIDVEHILPQKHFSSERFVIANLNIACKRCNVGIKKSDISFIQSVLAMGTNYYSSNNYKFIHPNLDNYADNIKLKSLRWGDAIFNKYVLKNKGKALFTYEYFKLKELEIDTINTAQGAKVANVLSFNIRDELRSALLRLLTKL